MKKIVICGEICSGKTWLAKKLSEIGGIDVIHTDRLYFEGNWKYRTADERRAGLAKVVQRPEWIVEGVNQDVPTEIADGKFPDIDHLILLSFPLRKRFTRFIKRALANYGQSRPDIPDGAVNRIEIVTLFRIIFYKSQFMNRFTPGLSSIPDNVNFMILRTEQDVSRFLQYAQVRLSSD